MSNHSSNPRRILFFCHLLDDTLSTLSVVASSVWQVSPLITSWLERDFFLLILLNSDAPTCLTPLCEKSLPAQNWTTRSRSRVILSSPPHTSPQNPTLIVGTTFASQSMTTTSASAGDLFRFAGCNYPSSVGLGEGGDDSHKLLHTHTHTDTGARDRSTLQRSRRNSESWIIDTILPLFRRPWNIPHSHCHFAANGEVVVGKYRFYLCFFFSNNSTQLITLMFLEVLSCMHDAMWVWSEWALARGETIHVKFWMIDRCAIYGIGTGLVVIYSRKLFDEKCRIGVHVNRKRLVRNGCNLSINFILNNRTFG